MRLPHAEQAIVDLEKLESYCLNPEHPRGKHKARVFASALGMSAADAGDLRDLLLAAVAEREAHPGQCDEYGRRYTLDFEVVRAGRRAVVRSGWIILTDEDRPRLTTCFVLTGAEKSHDRSDPTP